MRATLILAMFTASLANAGWNDYEEVRDLRLDTGGLSVLQIESRSGSLEVQGLSGADEIIVKAIVQVPGKSDEKAQKIIADDLILVLEKKGDKAVLKGYFDGNNWSWGDSASVRLEISVPDRFALEVEDSSGSIVINDVSGDIEIDDSSGSIKMSNVGGSVDIEDGSGSISVDGVGEDIAIEDGSGSITVRHVQGSVTVDDGSGSVNVKDVGKDLIIKDDGSGSINYSEIQGKVENTG